MNRTVLRRPSLDAVGLKEVSRKIPGIVGEFDLRGDVNDRVTGEPLDVDLSATNGKYVDRLGTYVKYGADQARHTGTGVLLEGEGTNKCTCQKINPSATTNIGAPTNDGVLSIVDDADELAAAGLSAFGPNVFKLENPSAIAFTTITVSGAAADTTVSLSLFARVSGANDVRLELNTGQGEIQFSNTKYVRVVSEGIDPEGATKQLSITCEQSTDVYFILPQLEESKHVTSPIIGDNSAATATRATDAALADGNGYQYDFDNNPELKALLGSPSLKITMVFTFKARCDSTDLPDGCGVLGFGTATSNYAGIYYDGGSGLFQRLLAGRNLVRPFSCGDIVKVVVSLDGETGVWRGAATINGGDLKTGVNTSGNTLHPSLLPLGKLSLCPGPDGDKIIPMEQMTLEFRNVAFSADQCSQEAMNV